MEQPAKSNKPYPDEVNNNLLNESEFLLAVEEIVSIAVSENAEESDQGIAIMFHLGVLCYIQGVQLAVENLKRDGKINDANISRVQRQLLAVLCAQTRWEFAETYCKNMLKLELNPLGLLVVLKHISSENTGDTDAELAEAVDQAATIIEDKAKGELASVSTPPQVPDIGINLNSDLIPEFFKLLEKIGTFYMDRDKYETDEQKELHDRIVAIYQKISE